MTKRTKLLLEISLVTGVFATSIYLIFFDEINARLKKVGFFSDEVIYSDKPRTETPTEWLEGRKEFCSYFDKEKCVRGFELPENMNDLIFINGIIEVSTKPDSNTFEGLPPMALVRVKKEGEYLVYDKFLSGTTSKVYEKYSDVRKSLVLPRNIYLK